MPDVIEQITIGLSKPYFKKILKNRYNSRKENAETICEYIVVEQADTNIKNKTKEGKDKSSRLAFQLFSE